jgi:tRNA-specific 2-thiouridylase
VHAFTVGQRRGLGLTGTESRYVVELRPRENQVVVGTRAEASGIGLTCSRLSWIGRPPDSAFDCGIKIRYRTPERPGSVTLLPDGSARVSFREPVWGIAPGQLAVFYDGDRVLGGGTIDAVARSK